MPAESAIPPLVARVVIIPAAGDAGVLDYTVAPPLVPTIHPGTRVIVPLGSRRAIGIVVALTTVSSHPRLKPILAAVDRQPLLDAPLLQLCGWMADYYLCSLGEALSAAMPGSARVIIERVARLSDAAPASARLSPAEQTLLQSLAAGPLDVRRLLTAPAARGRRALALLQRKGLVCVEERVRGGAGPTKHHRFVRACRVLGAADLQQLQRQRPAQYAVYTYVLQHPLERAAVTELHASFRGVTTKLTALVQAGLLEVLEEEVYRPVLPSSPPVDHAVALNVAQRDAVAAVTRSIGSAFRTVLLWGVTGSGKTEVYLHCIAACLAAGYDALVLVPEISLTHQLIDRVRARFGERVAVLHSGLSEGERWDEWRKIARGTVQIVVGARSAVFAPLPRLGLVVIDEEHDAAYKQDDGIRYNGRDVAVMRAKLAGCPALLGSATPAMESFYNSHSGRYQVVALPERVAARPLPSVEIVDLRRSPSVTKSVLLSPRLAAAIKANLAARGQTLIFLNRRGFANFLQCHACGQALMCPNCSVTLTLHRRWQAVRCHHCDYTIPVPSTCSDCGSTSLSAWGAGTEQVEAALRRLLPGARIGRMDRDTTSRKGAQREILAAWERRDYDVLVGTQMVTKGHDIPGVTLVGVLLADLSLNLPDFRAAERTFQLLTQVAGRAGRGTQPGRVIVQTLQPDHPSLQCAQHHDYQRFAEQELATRRELDYPPFARLVQLRCEGEELERTEHLAHALATEMHRRAPKGVAVLGPAPAPLERLRGRFRWQILVRGRNGAAVRQTARLGREALRRKAQAIGVRLLIDVDPYNMM